MAPHSFEDCKRIEARWASVLDGWLIRTGRRLRPATTVEEWDGIDRVTLGDRGGVRLEYKVDEQAEATGNIFIEVVSNDQTGRAGWAYSCQADYLLYLVTPSMVLIFRPARIRAMLDEWRRCYPTRVAQNGTYSTLGICVPIEQAKHHCEYVTNLKAAR